MCWLLVLTRVVELLVVVGFGLGWWHAVAVVCANLFELGNETVDHKRQKLATGEEGQSGLGQRDCNALLADEKHSNKKKQLLERE